jgi:two-component system LytT family sensor kinase
LDITPFSGSKFRLVFITWWVIWATVQGLFLYRLGLGMADAFTDSIVSNVLIAASCLLVMTSLKYYQPRQEHYWHIFILSFILTGIWLVITKGIVSFINKNNDYQLFLSRTIPVRFGIGFLLIACMAMISLVWYSLEEQKKNESRKIEAEKLSKEAELYKLRQQLQPHFLFNSLNSINALIGTSPEQARAMIQQLSDFLRGTIRREERQWVFLSEEFQYLELYLAIEKQRFGHRLSTCIDADEASTQMKLPNMLLQPIVENAIKFGLYDTTGEITIKINAKSEKQQLIVSVQNPFDAQTAEQRYGTGFGLSSVQRRLYLLFARTDLLETITDDGLFNTIIRIPQQSP